MNTLLHAQLAMNPKLIENAQTAIVRSIQLAAELLKLEGDFEQLKAAAQFLKVAAQLVGKEQPFGDLESYLTNASSHFSYLGKLHIFIRYMDATAKHIASLKDVQTTLQIEMSLSTEPFVGIDVSPADEEEGGFDEE